MSTTDAQHASGKHEDESWNLYHTPGATMSRNHAKVKAKFDQSLAENEAAATALAAKRQTTQSKTAAANRIDPRWREIADDFVLDPEFVVRMGHAALRQGVEDIQHKANRLGSGGPIAIVMTKGVYESFFRALKIQHSDALLDSMDRLNPSAKMAKNYDALTAKCAELAQALFAAGGGEHSECERVKKEIVPVLHDLLLDHLDHKEEILHPLFTKIAGTAAGSQAAYLQKTMPDMASTFMVGYVVKTSQMANHFSESMIRQYCGSIKLMAGDNWEAVTKPELAKGLGAPLWQTMQDLGITF